MTSGTKLDDGKRRYDLLPWRELGVVVDVVTFGCRKYGPKNWQAVENGGERFVAAAMRHVAAHAEGERTDSETGLPHLAHAACSLLFAMWFDGERR